MPIDDGMDTNLKQEITSYLLLGHQLLNRRPSG